MKIPIIDKTDTNDSLSIPDGMVDRLINPRFIAQAVRVYLANKRQDTVHTKMRGEVRGGGKKPWRQKGTGRARHGSIRSPLWKGGGVTFGPLKERNHYLSLPATMRQTVRKFTLLDKIKDKKVMVISKIALIQLKTKSVLAWLAKLGVSEGNILIITEKPEPKLLIGARNLAGVIVLDIKHVNMYEILAASQIIIEVAALTHLVPGVETIKLSNKDNEDTKPTS